MMEASGKGKCMFASKISTRHLTRLILLSVFWCASYLQAQQQPGSTDQAGDPAAESLESQKSSENRRIDRLNEGSADEWEMDLALPSAAPVATSNNSDLVLPDEDQNRKLQQLLSSLAADPGNTKVLGQLNTLLADVLDQANSLMDDGALEQAGQLLPLIHSIDAGFRGLDAATERLKMLNEAIELLLAGDAALESQRFLAPENDNALYYYTLALSKDPQSKSGQLGLARVQKTLVDRALESARELDFDSAEVWLLDAASVVEDQKAVEDARIEVSTFKQERAAELEQKAIAAMNSGEFNLADFSIIDLIALGGQEARVEVLRPRLEEARVYGGFEPGQIITDELKSGGKAPEVVIIAAGSFLMGSKSRADNEKPKHRITIEQGFALGTREVSVEQFRLFIKSSGYRTGAERKGSSSIYDEAAGRLTKRTGINWRHDYKGKKAKPDLPVLHVNALDAREYIKWLSSETGKEFRLPSEAEYEYVARAGGRGTYWWGEGRPPEAVENLTGERDRSPGKRNWTTSFKKYGDGHWGPAPVGSLGEGKKAHPMGVYDIAGNVSEWMQDCWHQNYMKAPVDGSAWVNPGCDRRVVRGGYWAGSPEHSRAAFRISAKAETYGPVVGFRVARDL
jgi:formylglycine-generating enzyme required for sulfatase activity